MGCTGEYWPEVMAVYKTTEGQYSPVRLELARLVSSLLYGTWIMLVCFLLKRISGHLNSKGFLRVFLMMQATHVQYTRSVMGRKRGDDSQRIMTDCRVVTTHHESLLTVSTVIREVMLRKGILEVNFR